MVLYLFSNAVLYSRDGKGILDAYKWLYAAMVLCFVFVPFPCLPYALPALFLHSRPHSLYPFCPICSLCVYFFPVALSRLPNRCGFMYSARLRFAGRTFCMVLPCTNAVAPPSTTDYCCRSPLTPLVPVLRYEHLVCRPGRRPAFLCCCTASWTLCTAGAAPAVLPWTDAATYGVIVAGRMWTIVCAPFCSPSCRLSVAPAGGRDYSCACTHQENGSFALLCSYVCSSSVCCVLARSMAFSIFAL